MYNQFSEKVRARATNDMLNRVPVLSEIYIRSSDFYQICTGRNAEAAVCSLLCSVIVRIFVDKERSKDGGGNDTEGTRAIDTSAIRTSAKKDGTSSDEPAEVAVKREDGVPSLQAQGVAAVEGYAC
jgi:hypothetical protein